MSPPGSDRARAPSHPGAAIRPVRSSPSSGSLMRAVPIERRGLGSDVPRSTSERKSRFLVPTAQGCLSGGISDLKAERCLELQLEVRPKVRFRWLT